MGQGYKKYSRTANFTGFTAHRTTGFGLTGTLESQAADTQHNWECESCVCFPVWREQKNSW